MLALWRESGIISLDQAASWTVDKLQADAPAEARLPIDFDAVLDETPSELARTLEHRSPAYRVIVDGAEVDDLATFAGQPLHFIAEPALLAEERVRAVTSLGALADALRDLVTAESSDRNESFQADGLIGTWPYDHFQPECPFYDDAGYDGNMKLLAPGREYRDLTKVVRNVFWQDWNDVISSLRPSRSVRTFWEHIQRQGSSYTLDRGWEAFNLAPVGWNDRISSIANWG